MATTDLATNLANIILKISGRTVDDHEETRNEIALTIAKNRELDNTILSLIQKYRKQPAEKYLANQLYFVLAGGDAKKVCNMKEMYCNGAVFNLLNESVKDAEYGGEYVFKTLTKNFDEMNDPIEEDSNRRIEGFANCLFDEKVFRVLSKYYSTCKEIKGETNTEKKEQLESERKTYEKTIKLIYFTAQDPEKTSSSVKKTAELVFKYDVETSDKIIDMFLCSNNLKFSIADQINIFNRDEVVKAIKLCKKDDERLSCAIHAFDKIAKAGEPSENIEYMLKLKTIIEHGNDSGLNDFLFNVGYARIDTFNLIEGEWNKVMERK